MTIYLDNNATAAVAPEVFEAMRPYLTGLYGNPSSSHTFGRKIHGVIEEARASVAGLIGAEPQEIIFASCGTESDNSAILSAVETSHGKGIVTTVVEHPAVLNTARRLGGAVYLNVDSEGRLNIDELANAITPETAVVSVMYANNETGVIFPVSDISRAISGRAIFHTDAVQAVGKIPINVGEDGIDMLSISGHKLHAPKGVGALYLRKGVRFHPMLIGGGQERGRRAGTENVASIVGLGKACELARAGMKEEPAYIRNLRDKLESGLLASCPDARVTGSGAPRLPNTTNISFAHVDGEAILLKLDMMGICVSTGSACASGSHEPSHVLRAMKVPQEFIGGSVRFSLSRYNTESEVDEAIRATAKIIKELRDISPLGRKGKTR